MSCPSGGVGKHVYSTLVGGAGVLTLCRDAVGVFWARRDTKEIMIYIYISKMKKKKERNSGAQRQKRKIGNYEKS